MRVMNGSIPGTEIPTVLPVLTVLRVLVLSQSALTMLCN